MSRHMPEARNQCVAVVQAAADAVYTSLAEASEAGGRLFNRWRNEQIFITFLVYGHGVTVRGACAVICAALRYHTCLHRPIS